MQQPAMRRPASHPIQLCCCTALTGVGSSRGDPLVLGSELKLVHCKAVEVGQVSQGLLTGEELEAGEGEVWCRVAGSIEPAVEVNQQLRVTECVCVCVCLCVCVCVYVCVCVCVCCV